MNAIEFEHNFKEYTSLKDVMNQKWNLIKEEKEEQKIQDEEERKSQMVSSKVRRASTVFKQGVSGTGK